jgi:hypothetical protein
LRERQVQIKRVRDRKKDGNREFEEGIECEGVGLSELVKVLREHDSFLKREAKKK